MTGCIPRIISDQFFLIILSNLKYMYKHTSIKQRDFEHLLIFILLYLYSLLLHALPDQSSKQKVQMDAMQVLTSST